MPITMQWHNAEQDILHIHYVDYTIPEHYQAVDDAKAMMDAVDSPRVDIIGIMEGSLKALMQSSQHGSNILSTPHPRLGIIVFVYTHRLMLPLIIIGMKFDARTRKYYRVAPTVEQAEAVIAKERAK